MRPVVDIRRQLDLPPERACALGSGMITIVDAGEYVGPSGRRVSIAESVRAAIGGTIEYGPDDPIPPRPAGVPGPTRIHVTNETTLAAARRLLQAGHAPAALNRGCQQQ